MPVLPLSNEQESSSRAVVCFDGKGGLVIDNRYFSRKLIKEGGGIRTYEAYDQKTSEPVIIKLANASELSSGAHLRLDHKARILRRIHTPTIVSPRQFGWDGEYVYLVRPYLKGYGLDVRLKAGPLSLDEVLVVAKNLLEGLQEVHDQNVIHQDIKPSNILVDSMTSVQTVHLIDFSLAGSPKLPMSLRDQRVGTVAYMSPEQSGLLGSGVDERTDLYSLGVMLYECLTGKCPFSGNSINEILDQHLSVEPPPLVALGIPRALDEILQRMLRKDPRDRYQTAKGALIDVQALISAREEGESDPVIFVGREDRRRTLTESSFVGRRREVDELENAWTRVLEGRPGLLLLEGESGTGKTRLLEEFAHRLKVQQASVYWGQGLDESAQRPFQLFVGVSTQVAEEASELPSRAEQLRRGLKDEEQAACTALPELTPILEPVKNMEALGPEDYGPIRNIRALVRFLSSLGSKEHPALVLLDDCQWADALSTKLIHEWHRELLRNSAEPCYVLVIAAFRGEEVGFGHPLRRITGVQKVTLSALQSKEVQELAESMAGPVPAEVMKMIEELSDGSPFMAGAVLRGLVESGVLVAGDEGWVLVSKDPGNLSFSRRAAVFLMRRLELLPAPMLHLLTVGSILGKSFDVETAAHLAGQSLEEVYLQLVQARRAHIIWLKSTSNGVTFVHDKLREALLQRISLEDRKKLHLSAAEYLERTSGGHEFEIAYHFDAAGSSERALSYALSAAEQARARHSLEIAQQQYEIAKRGLTQAGEETIRRVRIGLGEVLLLKGDYDGSERELKAAAELTPDPLERAKIMLKLGELAFKKGDVRTAATFLETTLAALGRKVPRTSFMFFILALKEVFIQLLHTLFPKVFVGTRSIQSASKTEFISIGTYSRLTYTYWFSRGKIPCAWSHLREMNLAEKYQTSPELAQAYSEHAPIMTMVPLFNRGLDYAKRGLTIRRNLGDIWAQGQSLHFYGVVAYAASQFEDCIERCREAVRLMERTGDRWEVNTANWHIAYCLYRLGDLKRAFEIAKQVYHAGREIEDRQAMGISLSVWSKATFGRVPKELIQEELARDSGDAHTRVEILVAFGIQLLGEKDYARAVDTFFQAKQVLVKAGLQQEYVVPVYPWLITALRMRCEMLRAGYQESLARKVLKQAFKELRPALRLCAKYRNNLPHILREQALLNALKGRDHNLRKYLNESISVAEAQGQKYEVMQSLWVRGNLGRALKWTDAETDAAAAREMMISSGYDRSPFHNENESQKNTTVSFSQLDRLEMMLAGGKTILAATQLDEIFRAVESFSKRLLRGEICLAIRSSGPAEVPPIPDAFARIVSRDLLNKAVKNRRAVAASGSEPGSFSDSLVLSAFRCALCAPIYANQKLAGVIYLAHGKVGSIFEEEELKLVEFVAALAGIAIENVQSIRYIEGVNKSLRDEISRRNMLEGQLTQKANELARSNKDLERFAYVASHDLKEPLRMIRCYIQLLNKRYRVGLGAEAQEYIKYAVDGAERMYGLIDGLLEYSRLTDAKPQLAEVPMQDVVTAVISNLAASIRESGVKLNTEPLPTVAANRTQMIQLMQNLIANAIKFRVSGRAPEVNISVGLVDGEWQFSVSDNGVGFDASGSERIFEIFQRMHSRTEYPGLGVGLAVCKRIVLGHGGRIWVESTPQKGSCFFFSLPVVPPAKA